MYIYVLCRSALPRFNCTVNAAHSARRLCCVDHLKTSVIGVKLFDDVAGAKPQKSLGLAQGGRSCSCHHGNQSCS